ncbi:MAG: ABC transporter substrate-binding protein [Caldilineaceae bacterium]|nr:ABC transporter substrate-binding protein [Caldilineaceae bacterium]
MPVTVEVTRVVTQPIVVQATPLPPMACTPPALDATAVITVGAILPLSLPGAMNAGFAMQTALSLAVEEINANGGVAGRTLALISYDSSGRAERSRIAAQRLILDDCVAGIVGLYHSAAAQAAADVAHSFGTPLIVAAAADDDLTAAGYPEVFRIAPSRTMLAEMPVHWLSEVGDFNQDGQISAGVVSDSAGQSPFVDMLLAGFAAASVHVNHMTVDLPSTDFSSAVARIVTMETVPDAIFILLKGADALKLQSQILAAGIGPQKSTLLVLQHTGLESDQFWQDVPDGLGTVVARIGPWQPTVTAKGQQFALAYGQYKGHWPEAYAFAAYDAVYLLADAVARAGSLQGPALVVALEETDLELASGRYSFPFGISHPPGAAGVSPSMWHQWPDVQTLYLQYTEDHQPAYQAAIIWPRRYRTVDAPLAR